VYGERERDGPFGVGGCEPRGDFDHQPVRRFDSEGLSGVSDGFEVLVSRSARVFLFLRVKVKPRGSLMGVPGRDATADDEESEPDSG